VVGWDYWVVADDAFSMLELLIGLPNVRVLSVERVNDVLEIHLETADPARFCLSCGMAGVVKDRPKVRYADLPFGGQQAVLVWHKYRWECPGENTTWTEERPDIAARSMSALTHRAAVWATIQVGRLVRPVSQIAAEIGVSWNTVMNAVSNYGRPLIDDPDRSRVVAQLGVDETVFQSAGLGRRRSFVTAVSDIEARRVLDVFEGRQRVDLAEWLDQQGSVWCGQVKVVVTDLHEPSRKAATEGLPNATLVADPMHVVMAANRCPDKTRRRVQNDELLHRGRTNEPLYAARKLLLTAAERLSPRLAKRLDVMLAFGDPNGQVYEAWMTKELVRDLYTLWGKPDDAARWIDSLIDDCRTSAVPGVKGLGRVLKQWRDPILSWHTTGASNGPAEGLNSIIKKLKRVATGFRRFDHYRTRILLAIGGVNWNNLDPARL
jgi:transposase